MPKQIKLRPIEYKKMSENQATSGTVGQEMSLNLLFSTFPACNQTFYQNGSLSGQTHVFNFKKRKRKKKLASILWVPNVSPPMAENVSLSNALWMPDSSSCSFLWWSVNLNTDTGPGKGVGRHEEASGNDNTTAIVTPKSAYLKKFAPSELDGQEGPSFYGSLVFCCSGHLCQNQQWVHGLWAQWTATSIHRTDCHRPLE